MNIAGPLATLIFGLTVLTVFGGLFAYAVYKARERTRKKPSSGKKSLMYFVEYELPIAQATAVATGPAIARRPAEGKPWGLYALSLCAVAGLCGVTAYYYQAARRLVLQGAWGQGEYPAPPDRPKVKRGPVVVVSLDARRPSLFPSAKYDTNLDGAIQPEERKRLHAEVDLTVLLAVDDNGHAQGMRWLYDTFERHKLWGKVTFFLTGNYLEGKQSYLGGPVGAWWNALSNENFVGLHGLTPGAPGTTDTWVPDRWNKEHVDTMKSITDTVEPPDGWAWASYPWGARAPYLSVTDAYFAGLERLAPRVVYDASMVVHPTSPPPAQTPAQARDSSWPFSLAWPLPIDVELPFSEKQDRRVLIENHTIVEVPVYAWAVQRKKNEGVSWIPSLDVNFFDVYRCTGDGVNEEALAAFEQNLDAHYQGNRAPFHLGLHAQNYMADKKCERKTIEAMLEKIDQLIKSGRKIKFEAMPQLLERLSRDEG